MTKSFLFCAFLAAALNGYSAAARWGASSIQASPNGAFKVDVTTYAAYLYIIGGNVTFDSVIAAWSDATTPEKYNAVTGLASASRSTTAFDNEGTPTMTFSAADYGDYKDGDTVSAFMIITDSTSYDKDMNYLIALNEGVAVSTKTFTTIGKQTLGWGSQSSNTDWKAIPEPFSGALVLLGLAGIGLRRKLKKAKKAA